MAGLLQWNDSQREKAGLARPGTSSHPTTTTGTTSGGSLRLPTSPFHRTPSSPALNSEFFSEPTHLSTAGNGGGGGGKESLADLWASFLEQSVDEAREGGLGRKDSLASSVGTAPGKG